MEWAKMMAMYQQGVAIGDIANVMGLNRKTVSKYVKAASPPRYERKERASKLDPFKEYVRGWLAENSFTMTRMMRELKAKGYDGGLTILKEFMALIKDMSKVVADIPVRVRTGRAITGRLGRPGTHPGR